MSLFAGWMSLGGQCGGAGGGCSNRRARKGRRRGYSSLLPAVIPYPIFSPSYPLVVPNAQPHPSKYLLQNAFLSFPPSKWVGAPYLPPRALLLPYPLVDTLLHIGCIQMYAHVSHMHIYPYGTTSLVPKAPQQTVVALGRLRSGGEEGWGIKGGLLSIFGFKHNTGGGHACCVCVCVCVCV